MSAGNLPALYAANRLMGPLYYFMFTIMMTLILINVFIAIMCEAYDQAKAESRYYGVLLHAVLWCAAACCTVLCCTVLCFAAGCCAVLGVLCYCVLCCAAFC